MAAGKPESEDLVKGRVQTWDVCQVGSPVLTEKPRLLPGLFSANASATEGTGALKDANSSAPMALAGCHRGLVMDIALLMERPRYSHRTVQHLNRGYLIELCQRGIQTALSVPTNAFGSDSCSRDMFGHTEQSNIWIVDT